MYRIKQIGFPKQIKAHNLKLGHQRKSHCALGKRIQGPLPYSSHEVQHKAQGIIHETDTRRM